MQDSIYATESQKEIAVGQMLAEFERTRQQTPNKSSITGMYGESENRKIKFRLGRRWSGEKSERITKMKWLREHQYS